MSTSTNAHIAFGIDLGEDLPEFLEDIDFDDWVCEQAGITSPDEDFNHAGVDLWALYFEQRTKALKEYPVTLIRHCSDSCPMYILAVTGTHQYANRGYSSVLKPWTMEDSVTPKQKEKFLAFLDEHNIFYENLPQWLLFSSWGC